MMMMMMVRKRFGGVIRGLPRLILTNNAFYLSVNVFSTKVLIRDTIFTSPTEDGRRNRRFTWSSEPREGPAACRAKGVPSFLSYFKTLSIGPAPGIEPATSRSAFKSSTD